jgi:glycine/D-amino acid oxidase-like deaminating enzyme
MTAFLPPTADAVVVGAGIVGASCAYHLAQEGLSVVVVDQGPVSGGTTGAGEGNILVSDKGPGPELDLALLSGRLWPELAEVLGPRAELEAKGGLVVANAPSTMTALLAFAGGQREVGVLAEPVEASALPQLEPHIAAGLAGGVYYPQDQQVQPMLATALMLAHAQRACRARVVPRCEVRSVERDAAGAVRSVVTNRESITTRVVVNAAGTWGGELARRAGSDLPVLPRRGVVLVTEPLPNPIRHKVYSAEYVANVASGDAGLQTSTVVEGTPSGTVLIGASRERVGFDRSVPWDVPARLARQAVALFPFLDRVRLMRTYTGFRPYCPDHLPVIGPDPRVPGLFHACGHEGAGIGLAPATGLLVAQCVTGAQPALPIEPFAPGRFGSEHAA